MSSQTTTEDSESKKNAVAGRKGDPRMNRAVAVREANPSMSLFDALREGGFIFPEISGNDEGKSSTIEDADGVRLSQRKNQLIRRLRVSRKKRKPKEDEKEDQTLHGSRTFKTETNSGNDADDSLIDDRFDTLQPASDERGPVPALSRARENMASDVISIVSNLSSNTDVAIEGHSHSTRKVVFPENPSDNPANILNALVSAPLYSSISLPGISTQESNDPNSKNAQNMINPNSSQVASLTTARLSDDQKDQLMKDVSDCLDVRYSSFLQSCAAAAGTNQNLRDLTMPQLNSLSSQLHLWGSVNIISKTVNDPALEAIVSNSRNDQGIGDSNTLIHKSERIQIFSVTSGSMKLAIKVLDTVPNDSNSIVSFFREYDYFHNIQHPGVRKVYSKNIINEKPALFLEWVDGTTLRSHGRFSVREFLITAREIVSALVSIHSKRIMHNNLTADNILISHNQGIKIIGFQSALKFYATNATVADMSLADRDVNFISPEALKMTNCLIDFRADFYSLGVVFYFMLCGKLPFHESSKWDVLRKQIFESADPVHIVAKDVPQALSNLASKLMEKNANDRYQSTKGILFDLDWMLSEIKTDAELKSIQLAEHDISEHFFISQKLYGRELEMSILLASFNNVRKNGMEMLMVRGNQGVGKTSLILDMQKHVLKQGGIFVSGKFDQAQRNLPYSALVTACESLCDYILQKDEETIIKYRRLIQEAVGEEGKLLTDVIKNLHLIIGQQRNVVDAIGKETKYRFTYVFCKFLNAVSSCDVPLVLFVDDLQWADWDSLHLLTELMTSKDIQHVMAIGVYTKDKISDTHPLQTLLQEIRKRYYQVHFIEVHNLSIANINDLLSDALQADCINVYSLTSVILKKTHGNPFLLMQFLSILSDMKLIYFCHQDNKWAWDLERIEQQSVPENVIDLLKEKLKKLGRATQKCLKFASCLGSVFSLSLLNLLEVDFDALEPAISAGLVIPVSSRDYRFAHDQIQQAALALVPKCEQKLFLFEIGRVLWKKSNEEQLNENLFVIANLMNSSISFSMDHDERTEIAKVNLKAGKKAKMLASFKSSLFYCECGISWLDSTCWKNEYDLSLSLYNGAAEAYFCLSNYKDMELIVEEILKNAKMRLDCIFTISLRIKALSDQHLYSKCIDVGIATLKTLDEYFLCDIEGSSIAGEYGKIYSLLRGKPNDEITKFSNRATDGKVLAILEILDNMSLAVYNDKPHILSLVVLRNVQLSLEYGCTKFSAHGFASFAILLCSRGEVREGFRFGQLALTLIEKYQAKDCLPKVYNSIFFCVNHWLQHIHDSISPLMDTYRIGLEVGSHDFAFNGATGFCMYSLISGKPLENLKTKVRYFDANLPLSAKGFKFDSCHYAVHKLTEKSPPASISEPKSLCDNDFVLGCFHLMFLAFFFNEYSTALKWRNKCENLMRTAVIGTYHSSLFVFYNALILLATVTEDSDIKNTLTLVKEDISKMRRFCEFAHENYQNKILLIEAESAVLEKNFIVAIHSFDRSITSANQNGFIHEEALAYERAGIFYRDHYKDEDKAIEYLQKAFQLYDEWGAKTKTAQLEILYPNLCNIVESSNVNMDSNALSTENQSAVMSEMTESNYGIEGQSEFKRLLKRKRFK